MAFKYIAFILPILLRVTANKSLTLVIDTTFSMELEIDMIKSNMGPILNSLHNLYFENYILVPFNDPDVGPAQTFSSSDQLILAINSLQVSGGQDIPENSLSGLEKALQESRPDSNIFLFTDACAKDYAKFSEVERLCRSTRSKIVIFMSGNCAYTEANQFGSIDVYYDVCKVCSGNVFLLDLSNFRQAFRFMKEIVKDDYTEVAPFESFTGYRELPFTADSFTRDVIVAVSGEFPAQQILHESGQSPRTEKLIDTRHSSVIRIIDPHKGRYLINVRCQGVTWVTIYKRKEFPFKIGFSSKYPRSLKETSSRPIPGQYNYILIEVPRINTLQLKTMIFQVVDGDVRLNLDLVEIRLNSGIYVTHTFFEAQKAFRIEIRGQERNSYTDFSISSKILYPQIADTTSPASAAVVEIIDPESPLTDYEKNTTVACKVTGSPRPRIWWEDESGIQMPAEDCMLEYPATYISYVSIPSVTENRTLSCKAQTSDGTAIPEFVSTKRIQLYVYRPYVFQMIQTPKDKTFEYATEGRLYCQVHAYPEAEIIWYHNGIILLHSDDSKFESDGKREFEYDKVDNALVIKNMTTRFTGTYKCEVRNEVRTESFKATVNISGLETPEIEIENMEVASQLGEEVEMICRVTKGKPNPVLTWKYRSIDGFEFTDVRDDVIVDGEKLTINEVKSGHKGSYKCEAVNDQGQDSREIVLKVHYAPKIEDSETTTRDVIEDSPVLVELKCSVDADPKATVRWERSQGDVTVPLDDKHSVDENNTLRFVASFNDSGTYRCIAENEAGSAEKITNVNVLVPPYITPVSKSITARVGVDVVLPCNVECANPAPSITWKFTALDSSSTVLFRGQSLYLKDLRLESLSEANAGIYQCIVENSVGSDRININLNVI